MFRFRRPHALNQPQTLGVAEPEALFRPDPALAAGNAIEPYAPIVRGVWMGWPKTEPVAAILNQIPVHTGSPLAEIRLEACEQAAWLTLEVEISWEAVLSRGIVGLGMDVACWPVGRMTARLRLPDGAGSYQDFEGRILTLRPEMQRLSVVINLPRGAKWPPVGIRPKIILGFTTEPKRLRFERLFVL